MRKKGKAPAFGIFQRKDCKLWLFPVGGMNLGHIWIFFEIFFEKIDPEKPQNKRLFRRITILRNAFLKRKKEKKKNPG